MSQYTQYSALLLLATESGHKTQSNIILEHDFQQLTIASSIIRSLNQDCDE